MSFLGGFAGNDTAVPMGGVMAGSALPAGLAFGVARRHVGRHPHTDEAFASA